MHSIGKEQGNLGMGEIVNRYLRYIGIACGTPTGSTCEVDREFGTHFHNMHLTVYETWRKVLKDVRTETCKGNTFVHSPVTGIACY